VASVLFQRASNEPETMNGTATRPTAPSSLAVDHIYPPINDLPFSRIREISRIGMEREGVIPLWFGEPDRPTPDFIIDAATEAMRAGKTFYTQNRGIPELRAALADYLGGLYGRPVDFERVTVTASAMNGLMIVMQTLLGPDDNVVAQGPLWPNTAETVHIQGAETREVTLDLRPEGWVLDLERLFDRCDGRTRAILVNSPSNPVGWMMGTDQQAELLAFCRQRGLWIISDEVYDRIVYDTKRAPSFVDLAEPEDLVLSVNSFSKSWCMTGWRLGWIVAPESLGLTLEKMNEYNIAGAATMAQWAGITALRDGEWFIAETVEHYRQGRDLVFQRLSAMPRVTWPLPEAAFYAYFKVDGLDDSLALAKELVLEHGVGLAPGSAFGQSGEGYLRLCFASTPETLSEAMDRLERGLA
jgi:aspartate/methionine/tyrosine aminotransferase